MASFLDRLTDIFAAAAFAEEGEHESAKMMLKDAEPLEALKSPSLYEHQGLAVEDD